MTQQYSREEWNRMREENTDKLREAVEELQERVGDGKFDHIWGAVKETRELFKLKPLDRDEQPQLWERFQTACRTLEEIQQANVEEVEDALRDLKNSHPLSLLDEAVTDANRMMGFDELFGADAGRGDMSEVWAAANEVSSLLHEKTLMPPAERRRLRDAINAYRDKLREIQNIHRSRYNDDCNYNFNQISNELNSLDNSVGERDFNDARRCIAEMLKTKRPMRRDEKNELWERFRAICRRDTECQIERTRERLSKQEDFLDKQKEQKSKLEGMLYEARSGSDYEDRVRGWINEVEEKIDSAEDNIGKLNDRLDNLKERL